MPHEINRLVLNFPGFETTTATHQIERLTAGGEKTARLWGFDIERSRIENDEKACKTITRFNTGSDAWQANTRYVHFSWSDIIEKYETMPYPKSLIRHLPGYLSFFFDGSFRRYGKTSRRYWGFSIYPLLLMIPFALLSVVASFWLLSGITTSWLAIAPLSALFFLVLCKWPGDWFLINLTINDWAFARHMCNSTNPDIEDRYQIFADQVIREIMKSDPDEILVVGHSFGSVWAVMALSVALYKRPKLFRKRRVTFLALGSSLLKIGLARRAAFLRDAIERLTARTDLVWHEIQTKSDFVSFYKSDPFTPMKIKPPQCEVIIHRVNFRKALSKERHAKMLKSMYLAHRQYILYCDRRVHHDFQLRVFGPFFADDLARDTDLALTSPLLPPQGQET